MRYDVRVRRECIPEDLYLRNQRPQGVHVDSSYGIQILSLRGYVKRRLHRDRKPGSAAVKGPGPEPFSGRAVLYGSSVSIDLKIR